MALTLFALGTAMLLISRSARSEGNRVEDRPSNVLPTAWFLVLTSTLAIQSGFAWFADANTMPAIICVLVLPCLLIFPADTGRPVRIMGLIIVTAGACCLILSGLSDQDSGGSELGKPGGDDFRPVIVFDDVSRNKELMARARACEANLELAMLRSTEDGRKYADEDPAAMTALLSEVASIIRTLERNGGSNASTALRLARLEANVDARTPRPE